MAHITKTNSPYFYPILWYSRKNQRGGQPAMNTQSIPNSQSRSPALAALRALPQVILSSPPAWAKANMTGTRAQGRAYENKVGEFLHARCKEHNWKLWDHQWFVFSAEGKRTYFQPDFIIEKKSGNLLIETKLTYLDTTEQINRYLYFLDLFGLTCSPVTIVKNLTPFIPKDRLVRQFSDITHNSVFHLWL